MPNNELATMNQIGTREWIETIKQTVCKGATDAQLKMFSEVCRSTGLNPWLKEIWYVAEKGIIMAARDGYLRVANEHPQFDGIETRVERDEKNVPIKAVCTVWRKDRNHPTICEAFYNEYRKSSPVWTQYPSAMISKVAEVLALKRTFSINGVISEEEMGSEYSLNRSSADAARKVAEAKINGTMPLISPETAQEVIVPAAEVEPVVDQLTAVLATFSSKKAISEAYAELKKSWLKIESEEAWQQTLEEFGIQGDNYHSFGNAKRCFTALWNALLKMMEEQPA